VEGESILYPLNMLFQKKWRLKDGVSLDCLACKTKGWRMKNFYSSPEISSGGEINSVGWSSLLFDFFLYVVEGI